MWLRLTLVALAAFIWIVAAWLSTHVSEAPTIFNRYSPRYAALVATVFGFAILCTSALWQPIYVRARPALANLVLVASQLLVVLVICEIAVRAFDLWGISYYEASSQYQLRKRPEPDLIYEHSPGWKAVLQDVLVEINEISLRDPPLADKQNGEWRVLVLGDSVTFGWGVPQADVFSRRLEGLLKHATPRPVRVINSGVGSYNTEQQLRYLQTRLDLLKPDLVVLVMTDNDDDIHPLPFDPTGDLSFEVKSPPEVIERLLRKSWTYRLVSHILILRGEPEITSTRQSEGWHRAMRALDEMAVFSERQGLPFVVFLYRMVPSAKNAAFLEDIQSVAARHNFVVEDTLRWFEGKNLEDLRRLTNSIVDSHPNSAGHEILAERMLHTLRRGQLLPEPKSARFTADRPPEVSVER